MAVYTPLTYAANSLLTSTKMSQNQDNFPAMAEGATGAPNIQLAAMAINSVGNTQLVDNSVSLAKMQDNSVDTPELINNSVNNSKIDNSMNLTVNSASIPAAQDYKYNAAVTKYLYLHPADFIDEWTDDGDNEPPLLSLGSDRILGCESLADSSNHWIAKIPVSPGVIIYKVEVDLYKAAPGTFSLFFNKIDLGGNVNVLLAAAWSTGVSKGTWRNAGTPNETTVENKTYEIGIHCEFDYLVMYMIAVKITYKYSKVYST